MIFIANKLNPQLINFHLIRMIRTIYDARLYRINDID